MADPFSFAIATVAQIGISYLFPSEGPRLKDLKISASTYGAAIPWVFGLTRVPGNMIWSEKIRERKKKKSGKGGSYNEYTYFCTYAMGLCKGPVKQIRRVWADSKLIYDASGGTAAAQASGSLIKDALASSIGITATSKYRMRFYMGDEEQLPDSAIEAELGANQAPAFRGMAYILFDDMPLEDFGNRIPQITAEVIVGDVERIVRATQITESDGTTDIESGYANGEAAFDMLRNYGYLRYGSGIKSFNLRTGRAVLDYVNADFGFEGEDTLAHILGCGKDGSLYVLRGPEGANMGFDRLDPFSLQSAAAVEGLSKPVALATASTSTSVEYVMTVDAYGSASAFQALDLTPQGTMYVGGSASAGPFRIVGRQPDATGNPAFYVLRGAGAGAMVLSHMGPAVQADVITITGTAVSPGPILWDSAIPGVLMFWSDGATRYISKWSEDTGTEVWRKEIPGYPPVFSNQTTLLVQNLGWLYNGRLYIIDTATGEWLDTTVDASSGEVDPDLGMVDWNDYLARYPDVLDGYYNEGGYTVAPTPQGYAQWHYTNYGAGEDRTLTYIGADEGQGWALIDEFAGAMGNTQVLDAQRGLLVALDGMSGVVRANSIAGGVSVGTIVQRMLQEGGLSAAQTDLSAIYRMPIRGYGWASGTDIKNILDELRRLFLFDMVERDGMLVAVARGDPTNGLDQSVETVPQNALGSSSEDAVDFWQETRFQEADLPASVSLTYMNIEDDYESSMARSARISSPISTMYSRQQVSMEINVVLTPKEAKVQTNKILYSQWLERTKHTTRLPWAYLNFDPGDVINVAMNDGRLYEDRLFQLEIGADFSIASESYSADAGAYDGWELITNADGGGDGLPAVVVQPGLALPVILNTPLLRDGDDQGGSVSIYYVGLANAIPQPWQGAALFRSTNNLDYDVTPSPDEDVEWGSIVGKLPVPHAGPFALDWQTRLKIQPAVDWFDIESITDDELWQGANACLVGSEVIQFRDAIENEDGTWTIWNLLRGRRGTEYACDTHKNGERFVFLSNTTIGASADLINARGQGRSFKAVAAGRSLQDSAVTSIIYEPRDLMPYAPQDIRRTFGPDADVTVSWSRRTRMGGNMQDGTGVVPLSERFEKYEVYILAAPFSGDLSRGAAPESYLRKYETSEPTVVYTEDEQGIDGYSPAATPLNVVIYQLSDACGRGFPGTRTIYPYEVI